ncbi:Beta-(1--_2)glucan export ATP-binding/permease protein NdvA [Rhodovastum atsumiense]|uniref:Glucan ABC transporter ATP-binding protein/ permease n=1 Tax=Rhodovastum atsumiense TaxID=504468 RepID=A0A5M6J136_9PROT|nr:glucan ABC transporter ATP-binding protein/ permease [Rhodovastum atsumiense]KAA5614316.1 glucan ABC transporter ATP-binding protein/ permease [Rhodovastum atsumiense]CAH2604778.1 Beta-(1-->2)glucan export ATP-binding/permease protein NdvA [Rhodovastum atsumiense]
MRIVRLYARVLALLGRDQRLALMLGIANVVVAGLQFLEPVLFGSVVQMLAGSDRMAPDRLWHEATTLLGLWTAVGLGGILANMGAALYSERLAHRNRLAAMSRFYGHVLGLPLAFHGEAHSGRMMKVMLSGADAIFWVCLTFFRENLSTFVAVLVLLPLTLLLNWRLALALVVLVALYCVMTILVIRRTEAGQLRAQRYQIQLSATAQDALANVVLMQAYTRLAAEARLFGDIVTQVIAHQFPVLNWWAVLNVMTRAASTIAVLSIVVLGTVLHVRGQASVGEIVSFMGIATMLIGRLDAAMSFFSRLFFEVPNLAEFFAILDTKSSVPERPNAKPLQPAADGTMGEVAFEDVSFAYPGGPPILSGVSFRARPGMAVALVGQTGAGKSTVMNLLQRLWDPTGGRVLIDGQDLRDVTLESVRRNIGVVFQESMLLNRSIRDNLLIGRPDATQAEIERACQLADAHEFIIRQPQGYDTMIGERGTTLSGGQRQRLSIARALLKDPPLLILDEATSALDAATEARVSRALRTLMSGRTTFIIAHRLSTVRDADEILVFEAGRIVERGSFDDLLGQQGRFAELVATQLAPAPAITHTAQ